MELTLGSGGPQPITLVLVTVLSSWRDTLISRCAQSTVGLLQSLPPHSSTGALGIWGVGMGWVKKP